MDNKLDKYVRSIPDFPEEGIIFRDITSVLEDADGFSLAINMMQDITDDLEYDVIAGAESRGFVFGAPIAYNKHKPFVLIRKKGKLPCETIAKEYELEYGTAVIEMHKDSVKPGQKVLLVDDLIATGGTTKAMIELIEALGGIVVGVVVMIELAGLDGRAVLDGYRLDAAITYSGK
ncbi:MAG: adenine phosphoribosyltransferase [Lachnospiraceae bacterium]